MSYNGDPDQDLRKLGHQPDRECCELCKLMANTDNMKVRACLNSICLCHHLETRGETPPEHRTWAGAPPQEKVEEDWEKYLEMGGEIIDYEGELRPEGVNKIKLLIEHLLASTKKETLEEVIRMLDDEYISRPHIKRMLTDLCNRLGI